MSQGRVKFRDMSVVDRVDRLVYEHQLAEPERHVLMTGGEAFEDVARRIENVAGMRTMPIGYAENFLINNRAYPHIPMCIEESSVVAAASYGAKLFATGGGFVASADEPVMTVQLFFPGMDIGANKQRVLRSQWTANLINQRVCATMPKMVKRGGGFRKHEISLVRSRGAGKAFGLVINVHLDVRDAMGANAVNTVGEALKEPLAKIIGVPALASILTNLTTRRCVEVQGTIPFEALAHQKMSGYEVCNGIVLMNRWANSDVYRAATHNKGVMNGIIAVANATGQDSRAIEAGAHAFSALHKHGYRALTAWTYSDKKRSLIGSLRLPLAVGTAGACIDSQPSAKVALKILRNPRAQQLACIMASVGLAQNLAALRALVTTGIQEGHMKCHTKQQGLARREE